MQTIFADFIRGLSMELARPVIMARSLPVQIQRNASSVLPDWFVETVRAVTLEVVWMQTLYADFIRGLSMELARPVIMARSLPVQLQPTASSVLLDWFVETLRAVLLEVVCPGMVFVELIRGLSMGRARPVIMAKSQMSRHAVYALPDLFAEILRAVTLKVVWMLVTFALTRRGLSMGLAQTVMLARCPILLALHAVLLGLASWATFLPIPTLDMLHKSTAYALCSWVMQETSRIVHSLDVAAGTLYQP
jgi:hypothetical protein